MSESNGPCDNKHCLMDQRNAAETKYRLEFENKQLRRIVEILVEPYGYREELSGEDFHEHLKEIRHE